MPESPRFTGGVGTALCAIPAIVTGLMRAGHYLEDPETDAATMSTLLTHRNLILIMAGVLVLALILRVVRRNDFGGIWRGIHLLLITVATGLVAIAGHLGAKLVYGKDYLPW